MKTDEEIDWFCNQTDQSYSQKLPVSLSWSLQCLYFILACSVFDSSNIFIVKYS